MSAPDRLPPIAPDHWSDTQRRLVEEIVSGPRGALLAPFVPLLRSPELMGHAQRMGEYLRYRSCLSPRLSELAILVTARHWTQQVEWAIHAPIALSEGLPQATVVAIGAGVAPRDMAEDERAVYEFCRELHENQQVCDASWARAINCLGEPGAIDLIGICGYYAFLSMVMNAARTPAPPSSAPPLQERPGRGVA